MPAPRRAGGSCGRRTRARTGRRPPGSRPHRGRRQDRRRRSRPRRPRWSAISGPAAARAPASRRSAAGGSSGSRSPPRPRNRTGRSGCDPDLLTHPAVDHGVHEGVVDDVVDVPVGVDVPPPQRDGAQHRVVRSAPRARVVVHLSSSHPQALPAAALRALHVPLPRADVAGRDVPRDGRGWNARRETLDRAADARPIPGHAAALAR